MNKSLFRSIIIGGKLRASYIVFKTAERVGDWGSQSLFIPQIKVGLLTYEIEVT